MKVSTPGLGGRPIFLLETSHAWHVLAETSEHIKGAAVLCLDQSGTNLLQGVELIQPKLLACTGFLQAFCVGTISVTRGSSLFPRLDRVSDTDCVESLRTAGNVGMLSVGPGYCWVERKY